MIKINKKSEDVSVGELLVNKTNLELEVTYFNQHRKLGKKEFIDFYLNSIREYLKDTIEEE